jgi:hypothetical protein
MIELAILKTFDSANHRASVQLVGSLTTYLDDIPVSVAIAPSSLVIGNRVLLAIPGGNIRDAVIIATWPGGTPLPTGTSGLPLVAKGVNVPPAYERLTRAGLAWTANRLLIGSGHATDPIERFTGLNLLLTSTPLISHNWRDISRFALTVTGSGAGTIISLANYQIDTGATLNSVCRLTSTDTFYLRFPWLWGFEINPRSASYANSEIWLAFMVNPATPSVTANHFGWRILNGTIFASSGNGTSGTQTNTGVSIAQFVNRKFVIHCKLDSWIRFYIGGVLVTTHSVGTHFIPVSGMGNLNFYIITTDAVAKAIWVSALLMQEVSETD